MNLILLLWTEIVTKDIVTPDETYTSIEFYVYYNNMIMFTMFPEDNIDWKSVLTALQANTEWCTKWYKVMVEQVYLS